jgi:hypothetical protein
MLSTQLCLQLQCMQKTGGLLRWLFADQTADTFENIFGGVISTNNQIEPAKLRENGRQSRAVRTNSLFSIAQHTLKINDALCRCALVEGKQRQLFQRRICGQGMPLAFPRRVGEIDLLPRIVKLSRRAQDRTKNQMVPCRSVTLRSKRRIIDRERAPVKRDGLALPGRGG